MSTGRIIVVVGAVLAGVLLIIDTVYAIYQHEKYNRNEYKYYERKELKRLVKEWHEENKHLK